MITPMKKYLDGVVVGRFQPFHKGHLDYVLKALLQTENLYIGITTPGKIATKYEPKNIDRFGKKNNPFTFKERKKMISALAKEGPNRVARVLFPVRVSSLRSRKLAIARTVVEIEPGAKPTQKAARSKRPVKR